METQNVVMDPREARELYRKYKTHVHWSCPLDREESWPRKFGQ
ncbi:hypothetical protein [Bradyrhizobium barranii]